MIQLCVKPVTLAENQALRSAGIFAPLFAQFALKAPAIFIKTDFISLLYSDINLFC